MNSAFLSSLTRLKIEVGKGRLDDDFSDRFNHVFSSLVLVTFTLLVSARQYIGKPIACWVPTEFTRSQEEYAESACWVTSTYFVPPKNNVPDSPLDRSNTKLNYYQWVPIVLLLQAFFFNVPYLLWRLFNWQSGMNLSSIMEAACEVDITKDTNCRQANVDYVAKHMEESLSLKRDYEAEHGMLHKCLWSSIKCCCIWLGKRQGNYLIAVYLISKLLYIVNIIGQIVITTHFIGSNYSLYGLNILYDLIIGVNWPESGNFPRVTMCDFEIRKLANMHRYTVQCVLPINMFNEKIYIFLWFWFLMTGTISFISFLHWTCLATWRVSRMDLIFKFLKLRGVVETNDRTRVVNFVNCYLRQDGVFLLRLIRTNIGERVAAEITEELWLRFIQHPMATTSKKKSRSSGRSTSSSSHQHHPRHHPSHQHPHHHLPSTITAAATAASGGLSTTTAATTKERRELQQQQHRDSSPQNTDGKLSSASSAIASVSRSSNERHRYRSGLHRQRVNEDPGEVV